MRQRAPPEAGVESKLSMAEAHRTVLIVDDDPQILRLVEKILGSRPVSVLLASGPSAALEICERQPVDLLISDVVMPEMDGHKLVDRVLKRYPAATALLISGQYKEMPRNSTRIRYLKKPFFPSDLIGHLRELLP